jgi:site-specific recombinase XerC
MHLEKAINEYLDFVTIEKGRSNRTRENYKHYLTRLVDFAGRY